jgi:hypothetical protein
LAVSGTGALSQAQTTAGTGSASVASVSGTIATSQAQKIVGAGSANPASVSGVASTSQAQRIAASGSSAVSGISGAATTSQAQTTASEGNFSVGAIDTHDGDAWVRFRKKLERIVNIQDAIEVVKNAPKEAIEAIQESDVKPKVKAKVVAIDYQKVNDFIKLQEFIAKQLLIIVELQRIEQENDDLLTFMMMD